MAKIDEKMLQMVVDMAALGGKREARMEALMEENLEMHRKLDEDQEEIARRDARIAELEAMLQKVMNRPQVVVNQYFMLSVPRTRDYVSTLSNDGRQFVGHMLHHTLSEDTPRHVIDQVDEITRLERQDGGGVVIQNNSGPVNGNIMTQNVGMPTVADEQTTKLITSNGRE